jgi:hypothetical protein
VSLTNPTSQLKQQALFYASRLKLKIIPIEPMGKRPFLENWTKKISRDPEQIRTWWSKYPDANIGIATGQSNDIIVLDVDSGNGKTGIETLEQWEKEFGSIPETPTVMTPTGGIHLYFRHPGFRVKNLVGKLAPHIDIRSDGAQVVAPGSIRKEGTYQWVKGRELGKLEPAELPEWLINKLHVLHGNNKAESENNTSGRIWAEFVAGSEITGGRDDYLFRNVACVMRAKGAGYEEIRSTIEAVYNARCTDYDTKGEYDPFTDKDFDRIASSAMKYEPGKLQREGVKRRPKIQTNHRHERDIIADAWDAIVESNDPLYLFQRERILMELRQNGSGISEFERVSEMSLRGILADVADWVNVKQQKTKEIDDQGKEVTKTQWVETPARVPDFTYKVMLHRINKQIPEAKGIVYAPIFARDGSLSLEEGYNQKSQLYYSNHDGMKVPEVPKVPSQDDIDEAKDLLMNNLFIDFPFKNNSSRTNALATLLYLFARELVNDIAPLHLIDAPTAGTGKTFLAKAIHMVATGLPAAMDSLPKKEEETEKKILSILMGGRPVVVLDNATGRIGSESLNRVLTSQKYSGRILKESRMIEVNNSALWLMTGNNVDIEGDIHRRIMWIRLDAKMQRAYQRDEWVHPDLLGWIREHRGALVWACLTIIQNWIAQGMPEGSKTMASYERWARVMSGILEAAGINGFLENREELIERASDGNDAWSQYFNVWWLQYKDEPVCGKDAFKLADKCEYMFDYLGDGGENARKSRFTRSLKQQQDVLHGSYVVRIKRDKKKNMNVYILEQVER